MALLSLSDIEKVNLAILEIYTVREPGEFFQKIVPLINDLLSSELASYNELDSEYRITRLINESADHEQVFRKHEQAARKYIPTHPVFGISSLDRCTLLSDVMEPDEFKKTAVYNEYYRHLDVESQMFTELPAPSGMRTFFHMGRARPFFGEREKFMLTLVKPHVIQAYRNTVELKHYRDKVALFEQGDDFPALHTLGLTGREATILGWAAKGKTNMDIASILGISRRTVEKHFERIYEKLGVETKIAAISVIVNTPLPRPSIVVEGQAP